MNDCLEINFMKDKIAVVYYYKKNYTVDMTFELKEFTQKELLDKIKNVILNINDNFTRTLEYAIITRDLDIEEYWKIIPLIKTIKVIDLPYRDYTVKVINHMKLY